MDDILNGIVFDRVFYEKSFDTSKGIYEILNLDLDKVVKKNILSSNNDLFRCNSGIILTRDQEQRLFRKYNYLKYRINKIKNWKQSKSKKEKKIKEKINALIETREIIIKCNTRLVIKPIQKFADGNPQESAVFDDLTSNAYFYMFKSIDAFDHRKGFKFSTYFSTALYKNLSRDKKLQKNKKKYYGENCENIQETPFFESHELQVNSYNQEYLTKLFEELNSPKLKKIFKAPEKRNLEILKKYYGVCGEKPHTLKEISEIVGLTKERVRQIKMKTENFIRINHKELNLKYDSVF